MSTAGKTSSFVLFEVAGAEYALASDLVQHMEMIEHVTPVPNAPPFVEGVVFSRGQVVPAVNLRLRFGVETKPHDLRTRLIVVSHAGRTVGLIVDSARQFLQIPQDAIQPPPDALVGPAAKYLQGIALLGDRMAFVVDIERLLNHESSNTPGMGD